MQCICGIGGRVILISHIYECYLDAYIIVPTQHFHAFYHASFLLVPSFAINFFHTFNSNLVSHEIFPEALFLVLALLLLQFRFPFAPKHAFTQQLVCSVNFS